MPKIKSQILNYVWTHKMVYRCPKILVLTLEYEFVSALKCFSLSVICDKSRSEILKRNIKTLSFSH